MSDTRIQVAIKLDNLSKKYGSSRGVESINLTVQKGEVFGFLGPNGAGKSTTINTMIDLLRPTSGTITILGIDANKCSTEIHKKIGYLAGDMETDLSLTGSQYLEYVANLRGMSDHTYKNELIERLKCETTKKIKKLSRGNRQKISLVAALMHDPDILILDEPTSGLDPLIQSEFNAIIKEHKARGKTTFMSSHVLSEVQNTCDRVGFIRDGELVEVKTLQELILDAPRLVEVTFKKDAPDTRLNHLTGVSDLVTTKSKRSFTYRGDYNELLQVLSTKPIVDLQIIEPALDDLFIGLYQGGSDV
jgi:ABC-2 type transport system ATP-binding protein